MDSADKSQNDKVPGKKAAWIIVVFVMLFAMFGFIAWFNKNPLAFGLDYKTPSEVAALKEADPSYEYTDPGNKTINGIYYWGTVTSTVGFGDICPKTATARMVTVMYEIFLTFVSVGAIWYITDQKVNKLKVKN